MGIVKIQTQQMIATSSVGYNSTPVGAGQVDSRHLDDFDW